MDQPKILLILGLLFVALGLGCLVALVSINSGSRNLVLAVSTLFGAAVLLGIQLPLELRSKVDTDLFSAEFTIDHAAPFIRQWDYGPLNTSAMWRPTAETEASQALAHVNPGAFDQGQTLNTDFALFSLVAYMAAEQFDWQMKRTWFKGRIMGTQVQSQRISNPEECSSIQETTLR